MRSVSDGSREICCVLYIDTMRGAFVSEYGIPVEPRRLDTRTVLYHGDTWEDVLRQIEAAG